MTVTPSRDSQLSADVRRPIEQALASLREDRATLLAEIANQEPVKDNADNADRIQLGDDLGRLDDRIAELADRLTSGATVADGLLIGTIVTVQFPDGTETLRAVPLPDHTADGAGTLSTDSPLSKALVGHKPGDTVTYDTPLGKTTVDLIDIKPPS
jgi:transcription elongation GreA/GreB family factor